MDFFVLSTPIGNYEDITLRGVKILKEADFVVCEHHKEYVRLSCALDIPVKEYIECQRKSELQSIEIVLDYLNKGKKGVLVSDCGTPLFEDPGFMLLSALSSKNVNIISLPGANSIMTALPLSHFEIKDFYFAGFISQKKEEREKEMKNLLKRKECIILLETPYRLLNILDLLSCTSPNRQMLLPFNLTMENQKVYKGTPIQVKKQIEKDNNTKGEFLIILSPLK